MIKPRAKKELAGGFWLLFVDRRRAIGGLVAPYFTFISFTRYCYRSLILKNSFFLKTAYYFPYP
jgi:hypothetical protein